MAVLCSGGRPAARTLVPTLVALRDRPACWPRVARWLHAQWWHRAGISRRGAEVLLAARAMAPAPLPFTWVACVGRQVVGTATLHPGCVAERPTLSGVYVLPRWRRRGIGAALCRQAAAHARCLGASAIELETEDAAGFYERLGWQADGAAVVFFAGRPVAVMRMRLPLSTSGFCGGAVRAQ